jgi:hypothetical protein
MPYLIVAIVSALFTLFNGALAQTSPDTSTPQITASTSTTERDIKENAPLSPKNPQAAVEEKKGKQTGSEVKNEPRQVELAVLGKMKGTDPLNFRYKMGEVLQIKATGSQAQKLKTTEKAVLFFDGVRMPNLTSLPIESEAGKDMLLLNFHLVRDSTTEEDRKAWDTFFKSKNEYLMTVELAIAAGNDLPVLVHSRYPLQFFVAENRYIWGTLTIGILILFISYYWMVKYTRMLHDADTNLYSLGKSQMAFWGLLVLLTFIGVWLLNGTMERIPPQALILLGISAATGLSAVVIEKSQNSSIQTAIDELRKKEQLLQTEKAVKTTSFSAESQYHLNEIPNKITSLTVQLSSGRSNGFWRDICDDGNGLSFHRLQVVGWTLILGVVFVRHVTEVMSMPEFSETLLTLMGISNATYLGFKIPEK